MVATHEQLVEELIALLERRAFHEANRIRTEVTTVHTQVAAGSSIAAAQRDADWFALEDRLAVIDLDAKIAALELRKGLAERAR